MGFRAAHDARAAGTRPAVLFVTASVHVLGVWALASATAGSRGTTELRTIAFAEVLTNNPERVTPDQSPQLREVQVLETLSDPVMGLPSPPTVSLEQLNPEAVAVAPRLLDDDPPDMALYARLAGLRPGESAVVVLRIEVLADGRVGQVEVDVSSGSRQVDEAALAYVQALKWIPGRLHGAEDTTWIRHGVLLTA